MKLTSDQKEKNLNQYDALCKKVLTAKLIDIKRKMYKDSENESLFVELSDCELKQLKSIDEYFSFEKHFNVFGFDIVIKNQLIVEALATLSKQRMEIVMLHSCLKMTDKQIGKLFGLKRSTIQYKRDKAIKTLRKYMESREQ